MHHFPLKGKRKFLLAVLILLSNVSFSQNIFVAPGGNATTIFLFVQGM